MFYFLKDLFLKYCILRPVLWMQCFFAKACSLFQYSKKTCDNREKGNTLNESGSQDHVRTNVISSLWLTRNRFYCTFTNLTDTNTGTDCS